MAMDVALAVCRTRFMFATHDDVFLRSREALQHWRDLAAVHRVAGHRLTPRPHDDWSEMFGHTALMLDVDFLLDQGITWNMRRGVRLFGIRRPARVAGMGNWPDTETGFNYLCRLAGVKPVFTGYERNYEHNIDDLIDHCRSAGGSALYNAAHADKAAAWVEQAIADAQERLAAWRLEPMKEAAPLPDERPPAVLSLPTFTPGKY